MSRPDQDSVLSDGVERPRRVPAFPRSRDSAIDRRLLLTATAAHFLNDFHVAFLAPLLPLVVVKFNLSLALAGLLATVLTTSAALSQPVFGIVADRLRRRIFVMLGPALTVLAMGLMGLAPTYASLLALLLIAGTGTASFHPQGASTAGEASGDRRGTGLSLFVAGGELGYSLGPLIVALVVAVRGLEATWLVALPGLGARRGCCLEASAPSAGWSVERCPIASVVAGWWGSRWCWAPRCCSGSFTRREPGPTHFSPGAGLRSICPRP